MRPPRPPARAPALHCAGSAAASASEPRPAAEANAGGQDLGALLTGKATDPNTGPILVLIAFCYWPFPRRDSPAAGWLYAPQYETG